MLIYLVRHAIADYTTTTPYGTMPGPPLTPEGEEQARAAAVLLERSGLERVVASPMRRCVQTAAAISGCAGSTQFDDDLGEMQAKESAGEMTVRMMRAALAQTDASVVALVSHAAPLENLLLTLTRNEFVLPQRTIEAHTSGSVRCGNSYSTVGAGTPSICPSAASGCSVDRANNCTTFLHLKCVS
ncbi:MAG: histidine phosphatase family protein [Chloroflexia bacterium]